MFIVFTVLMVVNQVLSQGGTLHDLDRKILNESNLHDYWDRQEPSSPNSQNTDPTGMTSPIPTSPSVDNTTTEEVTEAKRGYRWSSRVKDGDTSPGYHLGRTPQAIASDPMHMFLTISLPIAICGIMLALLCIFGLRPDGYLCKKMFSDECEVMVQKI